MIQAENVQSVSYVRVPARAAFELLDGHSDPTAEITDAWLFVEYGDFHQTQITTDGPRIGPLMHTLSIIVEPRANYPFSPARLSNFCYNLPRLGPVNVISAGQVPELDAKRAPGGTGQAPYVNGASCPSGTTAPLSASGDTMALDANPSTPAVIDASRTVTGTAQFSLGINVTADADPYKGYEWEIEYPPAGLAFDGAVVENTSATGLGSCTGATLNTNATPITAGDTVYGNGAGCISASQTFQSSYVGQTTTFHMHCLTAGTFAVQLLDFTQDAGFGSTLFDASGATLDTSTAGITITCQ